jgi:hypothetical protein
MALVSSALIARQSAKEASKISKKSLGFDFIPLLTSLILYYVIAFAFAKFMEASKFATGGFISIANFLGANIPSTEELPSQWNRLFDETGYNGVKFWDIINVVALLIIIATALNFQKNTEASGNQVQLITWAIFAMLGGFIIVTGISKLVMKLQERNFQQEFK